MDVEISSKSTLRLLPTFGNGVRTISNNPISIKQFSFQIYSVSTTLETIFFRGNLFHLSISWSLQYLTNNYCIEHHSWLNPHYYKIRINRHFFAQKVPFLRLLGAKMWKISIDCHLGTLIFLKATSGL